MCIYYFMILFVYLFVSYHHCIAGTGKIWWCHWTLFIACVCVFVCVVSSYNVCVCVKVGFSKVYDLKFFRAVVQYYGWYEYEWFCQAYFYLFDVMLYIFCIAICIYGLMLLKFYLNIFFMRNLDLNTLCVLFKMCIHTLKYSKKKPIVIKDYMYITF